MQDGAIINCTFNNCTSQIDLIEFRLSKVTHFGNVFILMQTKTELSTDVNRVNKTHTFAISSQLIKMKKTRIKSQTKSEKLMAEHMLQYICTQTHTITHIQHRYVCILHVKQQRQTLNIIYSGWYRANERVAVATVPLVFN